jgi:cell wall-associated NlpC family hydrolase
VLPGGGASATNSSGGIGTLRVDSVHRAATITGWAIDPRAPKARSAVKLSIDGRAYRVYRTDRARPDVQRFYPTAGPLTGYSITTGVLPAGRHQLCLTRVAEHPGSASVSLGCVAVSFAAPQTRNTKIAKMALSMVGKYAYRSGGTSPATGFDCSGLTSYLYAHNGKAILRTADQQYREFRTIPKSAAKPGDLVFFHSGGGTFHVGVYMGGSMIVAATTPATGIRYQSYTWWSNVTFGTIA